ncbi:hypothetical protein EPUS_05256 [Endocarpon pusillum Z07020]|uniref:Uncharacterized protein n=1 Tax=Endocarpon pusillum (strain Z07020 / HMAS-L-300199) TaxID=1263415 RepID=U1HDT7_ENDPU|nr:uncharacterized protein EPUS_05256 [Endocarpon pusillum Z07020]ERF68175.1 hypothetical protein EPUS_05256 [Endocarpon pusillum Z07020]
MSDTSPSKTPQPYQPNVRRRGAGPGSEVDEAESDAGSQEVAELNRRYPALRRNVEVVQRAPSHPRPPADRVTHPRAFQPWSPTTGETVPRTSARGADHSPILRNEVRRSPRPAIPPIPTRPDRPDRPHQPNSPEPHPHYRIVPEPPRVIVGLSAAPNAGWLPNTVVSGAAPQFAMGWGGPQAHPLTTDLPAEDWAARAPATTTAPPPPPPPPPPEAQGLREIHFQRQGQRDRER